jgi:hypothetical protein
MDILRDGAAGFHVGGHHGSMSPVALPPWLPANILQQMVDRFRGRLRAAITNAKEAHRRPSLERYSRIPSQDREFSVYAGQRDQYYR